MNTEKHSSVWGLLLNNNLSFHGVGGVNALEGTCWHCSSQWSSSCNLHHFLKAASLHKNNGCAEGQLLPCCSSCCLVCWSSLRFLCCAAAATHGWIPAGGLGGDGQLGEEGGYRTAVQGAALGRWGRWVALEGDHTKRWLMSNFVISELNEQRSPLWHLCYLV